MQNEIIIKCGVEGGSWVLLGSEGANGWRFRTTRNETALYDLLNEEDREEADRAGFEPWEESDWVEGWEAALALFDGYPWASFYPLRVHPDFAGRIWAVVQDRCEADKDEWARYNFTAWYRRCHDDGSGDFE
jgi:hypothetical protein